MRSVARQFGFSLLTVQRWVQRAQDSRLDRVEWHNRPAGPHRAANRVARAMEDLILNLRQQLRDHSDLGEFGAAAIRRELLQQNTSDVPSLPTINRILRRYGAFDAHRRVRRPPPPRGWYLPDVAAEHAELDQFDTVSGLVIRGGTEVEVLNAISLHGGLVGSWPYPVILAITVREALLEHWCVWGLPTYAQFDNDTIFQGPHQYPDVIGSVIRLCLSLSVVPVFAPPRESGFQAAIESFNGRWQAKVWARFQHESLEALQSRSTKYVIACRKKAAVRMEAAPERRLFPESWQLNLKSPLKGSIIFLRRTTEQGKVHLLGHTFELDPMWPHRLVRCEVDLDAKFISCYALRRREPHWQPLLRQIPYVLPQKRSKK